MAEVLGHTPHRPSDGGVPSFARSVPAFQGAVNVSGVERRLSFTRIRMPWKRPEKKPGAHGGADVGWCRRR
jgi:hypothetical protein